MLKLFVLQKIMIDCFHPSIYAANGIEKSVDVIIPHLQYFEEQLLQYQDFFDILLQSMDTK